MKLGVLFSLFLWSANVGGDTTKPIFILDAEKVNILFVEHGSPEFPTTDKCLLGDIDVPLSEQGKREANTLKNSLEKCGIVFEAIFSVHRKQLKFLLQILRFPYKNWLF